MSAIKLLCAYQHYDWGTRSAIPDLLNLPRPKNNQPLAEYWMGAHPALPARIAATGEALNEWIALQPALALGPRHAAMRDQLPYLFKVLSAARALSIQVHPDKQQAEQGFASERARGIDAAHPQCSYKDDNHKPELIFALTPFKAMVGFRQPLEIAALFEESGVPSLKKWISLLRNSNDALREVYGGLLNLEAPALNTLCNELRSACEKKLEEPWCWIGNLQALYGNDAGIAFPLLLNVLTLEPGEAIYLGAGIPHAYLEGTGLEVMANSDNVLRGGLTAKHMDRQELLRITRFDEWGVQRQRGQQHGASLRFEVPVPDFQFEIITLQPDQAFTVGDSHCAEMYLVLEGELQMGGQCFTQGDCMLWPAAAAEGRVEGSGRLARVTSRLGF